MQSSRPCILLGHGVRAAGAAHLVPKILDWGVPVLASWQAKDMVDHDHRMFFGCPGIYGNRAANKVLAHSDEILAIGNRCSIWNVGYEGFSDDQRLVMVDVDEAEVRKHPRAEWIKCDAKTFIQEGANRKAIPEGIEAWLRQCFSWSDAYPRLEDAHADAGGYINSYGFFARLNTLFRNDEVVTLDCGSACASAFQVFRTRPPQRLLSSGGLGEMGCALPAAIGASFARGRGEVICIMGDGAGLMNLGALQTIVHYQLPIKIIVAKNDGYLMIKHTQKNAGMRPSGVDEATGVSSPNYRHVALAFGITGSEVRTWDDFDRIVPSVLASDKPCLIEYIMQPEQVIAPKLGYDYETQKYRRFDEMTPEI